MSLKLNKKTLVMEYHHKPNKNGNKVAPDYVCIGFKISKLYKSLEERYG